jgi:hypothetical protein
MRTLLWAVLMLFTTAGLYGQENYKAARYYEWNGKRVDGFINMSFEIAMHFQFKKTLEDKPEKIKTWKQIAVVVEQDSFAVLHNFKVESDASDAMVNIQYGLGKVLETGKVNLYDVHYISDGVGEKVYRIGATYTTPSATSLRSRSVFLVQQQGSERAIAVEKGIDDFIKQMTVYFKMSAPIVERLKNKEYSYDKAPQLVHDFNTWYSNR